MLYVKIMSGEDMDDTSPSKHYSIIPIENNQVMQFVDNPLFQERQPPDSPGVPRFLMLVNSPDGSDETHPLFGNAYVMSESGKTIASHGC